MAASGEGGAVQDEVGGVLRCSEAYNLQVETPGAAPFILRRNLEVSTSSPSQLTRMREFLGRALTTLLAM